MSSFFQSFVTDRNRSLVVKLWGLACQTRHQCRRPVRTRTRPAPGAAGAALSMGAECARPAFEDSGFVSNKRTKCMDVRFYINLINLVLAHQ